MPIDPTLAYDDDNIFAKILRGEIPCKTVAEDEHTLAFEDINPLRAVHVLVIPKGAYVSFDDFAQNARPEEIVDYTRAIGEVCKMAGVSLGDGNHGFRMISNAGIDGIQEVPHLHVHVVGGRSLGRILPKVG